MTRPGKRVVVTDYTFPAVERERATATRHGAAFAAFQCRSAADVGAALRGADVALVQFAPVDHAAIAAMREGGAIVRYGVGYDNIALPAARARAISVAYVPDYCIAEVADHSAALLLALLRKIPQLDKSLRAGRWEAVAVARPLPAFAETIVGFAGLGRIGHAIMARLAPFGFRFLAADPALDSQVGVEVVPLPDLLARADALILCAPSTPETRGMINAGAIRAMKPGAVIVNCARGDLVVEADLAAALSGGQLGGAALDVFAAEPLADDSALRDAPNTLLTPHAAWYSEHAIARLQVLAAEEVERALTGKPPRCPVPG